MNRQPNGEGPSQRAQDLKATADSISEDASRLKAVEESKADLQPGDPELEQASADAVDLAQRIERQTRAEQELSQGTD
jgi:uncharacterized protein (DUF3084 family)